MTGGASRRRRWARLVAGQLCVALACAVLIEATCTVWTATLGGPWPKPTHGRQAAFWVDSDPDFGAWHPANTHFVHDGGCFSAVLETNSYGARDRERERQPAGGGRARTVVLGDSFVEGWGVDADQRWTNLLEAASGRPHLNFGSGGGFGPLQEAILYRKLAAGFAHDTVLVGILPDNDFSDMRPDGVPPGSGRPIFDPQRPPGPDTILWHGPRARVNGGLLAQAESILRAHFASYAIGVYVAARLAQHTREAGPGGLPWAGYDDWSEADLGRLEAALAMIAAEAGRHNAAVGVVLFPRLNDLVRFEASGEDRLGPALAAWAGSQGIKVLDLLPATEAQAGRAAGQDPHRLFHPCDGHWSAAGNAVAARLTQQWLDGPDGPNPPHTPKSNHPVFAASPLGRGGGNDAPPQRIGTDQ